MIALATSREVAEYLNISPGTLNNWASQGRGPRFIKIDNGIRRYDMADVRAWVEARKVNHG